MESFDYKIVEEAAKQLYIRALCDLPPDVREAIKKAAARETQPTAKEVFKAPVHAEDRQPFSLGRRRDQGPDP
jgi:tartrate dehydratase alpha subunit/fumarate hydratase class I-like protein